MAATTARRVRIEATACAVLMGGSLLGASSAQASPSADTAAWWKKPFGIVTAHSGLNIRQYPSTDSSVKGVLPFHTKKKLDCKVRAQYINGNTLWYKLDRSNYWLSGRYLKIVGHVKFCKDKRPSALNNTAKAKNALG